MVNIDITHMKKNYSGPIIMFKNGVYFIFKECLRRSTETKLIESDRSHCRRS